jgi:hypothetical protein
VDVLNAWRTTLPDYFGSEIDFVVGWADTRTELHDHVRGIGAEAFNHLSDCTCDNAELGAFAPGMDKANCRRFRIYDVNRATVRDVNAECDAALISNDAIAGWEFAGHRAAATAIDYSDVVTMDLLGGEERPIIKASGLANFLMGGIKPLEYLGFLGRDVDSRNSLRENVTTDLDRA